MKMYPEKNTVYCFAGSCEVKNIDSIDGILKMENCIKQEVILKAKSLCDYTNQLDLFTLPTNTMSLQHCMDNMKNLVS